MTIGNADAVTCIVTNDDVPPPPPDEDPYLLLMGPDAVNPVNTTHTFTATLTTDPAAASCRPRGGPCASPSRAWAP